MATTVTKEQAICMLYCEEYNDINVRRLLEKLNSFEDLEICYEKDPLEPKLIPLQTIYWQPHRFRIFNINIMVNGSSPAFVHPDINPNFIKTEFVRDEQIQAYTFIF
ncbi:uncharacterized protein BX663DRAFT_489685 [Cokeromyces recurvatus]|uniref:uncharacterized protein n=1 Tax=Cokeromyces recurvatus TaxID=90255 RepID=UPI00221F2CE1|nr:uncharacterized protein BX663DRAFT_489685 [Cokeromyces recurvatus]KAI7898916.1 hypothetical protein BX663DRAFT_489685 [Cokeromyces recurvatus]